MNILEKAKRYLDGALVIDEWLGNGGVVISQEDAQRRANTCLECKHNKPGPFLPFAIAAHIHRKLEIKKHLELEVSGEEDLKTCEKCDCPLRLKLWIPMQDLLRGDGRERLKDFPAWCWMTTETTQPTQT